MSAKGKPRGSIFEVRRNSAGDWYWHELAGGRINDVAQAYAVGTRASKSNAVRAARRKASQTKNSTVRIVD